VRGGDNRTGELFSYVDLEARVRRDHPLRAIRTIVNEALSALEREFAGLYSPIGRPSIPPEKLLRAMLLQPPMNRPGRKASAGPKPRAFVLVPKKGARFRITKAASVGGASWANWRP
jgi:hypothetical protein